MAEGGAVAAETRPVAEKCFHFHHYDFMNDKQFMKGWETISKAHADKEVSLESRLTTAKLFYYSRFIEPISIAEYTAWLKEFESKENSKRTSPGAHKDEDAEEEEGGDAAVQHTTDEGIRKTDFGEVEQPYDIPGKCSTDADAVDDADLPQSLQEDSSKPQTQEIVENISMVVAGEDDDDDDNKESVKQQQQQQPQYPTSFLEVMELVQAGQKIPGLEEVQVEPTNQPPTEPSAATVKKPWEA